MQATLFTSGTNPANQPASEHQQLSFLTMASSITSSTPNNGWIGDGGSEGNTLVTNTADGRMVATAGKQGTPFNVRLEQAASSASSYFVITIVELQGNVSIGLVSEDDFQPGWKTRGMFYNGNVTNGGASLLTGFGKYVKEGDVVGVSTITTTDSSSLEVQFYINQKCLGTAFSLTDPALVTKVFYPCVHVSGTVKFTYREGPVPPVATADDMTDAAGPAPCGDWKVEALSSNDETVVEIPANHDIVVSLQGPTPMAPTKINIKVANSMSGPIEVVSVNDGGTAMEIKIGPNLMSTMMMPPPNLHVVEQALMQTLPQFTGIKLSEDGTQLIMMGPNGKGELKASRYQKTFEPLTKY